MKISAQWLTTGLFCICSLAPLHAAQIAIIGPAGSINFGRSVTVLPNGNIVVTENWTLIES